ncbi:hypothetical protein BJY01DRAFT_241837 [Aspergillus pseudoustus]|uniref:Up-regulated in Daf-2 domain-containing protein n=1 Tax=Aspergillus pseudoustus TaxID=1810923 RepID=A0ABR4L4U0_9EURO
MRVTEETHDDALVYAADVKTRKPHMIFQATGTSDLPATVVFHNLSWTIDVSTNGEEMPMRPGSKSKLEYSFDSRALGGRWLTWKRSKGSKYFDLDCVDETGEVVYASWRAYKTGSGKKTGRTEILQPAAEVAGDKGFTDELAVTGLANVYVQIMMIVAAA